MVISPRSIPNLSWSTFATGARQLVVQEAFEMVVALGVVGVVEVDSQGGAGLVWIGSPAPR